MATTMEPEIEIGSPAQSRAAKPAAPTGRKRMVFTLLGVALIALVAMGARRWWFGRSHVSTDNAQVDGHVIPILPKVGGFVAEVRVRENQEVEAGDNADLMRQLGGSMGIAISATLLQRFAAIHRADLRRRGSV